MTWHAWTDGSYRVAAPARSQSGSETGETRSAGGWAAIVSHAGGSLVVRGSLPGPTSNMAMELTAIRDALRAVPVDADVVLHTDALPAVAISASGTRHGFGAPGLVAEVANEFLRRRVLVELIVRRRGPDGEIDQEHVRAHEIAGAESAQALGYPRRAVLDRLDAEMVSDLDRGLLRRSWRRELRPWRERSSRVYRSALPDQATLRASQP